MYSSYNKFDHNIYRDANIVTTIDTFTSILAGSITFGIVGHLKRELQAEDIKTVFQGGPGRYFVATQGFYLEVVTFCENDINIP